MKSALAGLIAPFTGITTTLSGAMLAWAAEAGGAFSHNAKPSANRTPNAVMPRINRPATPPRISAARGPDCRNGRRGYVLIADGCRAMPTGIDGAGRYLRKAGLLLTA